MLNEQVMGNNAGITVAGAWGQFELNVFKPMLIASLLQSTRCLWGGLASATTRVTCFLTRSDHSSNVSPHH